jgi:hypothetical protein
MRKILTGTFAVLAVIGVSRAQNTPQPANQQTAGGQAAPSTSAQINGVRIAPGSVIPVELAKTIDSKKLKTGEEVDAEVTQDMKTQDGEVIVAKDTEVIGHVTVAQPRTKEQKESQVGIRFDQAVMKNGIHLHLPMTIQAIVAPPSSNTAANESEGEPASRPVAGMPPSNTGVQPGGMGTPTSQQTQTARGATPTGEWPANTSTATNSQPPITGDTKGVVGYLHLELSTAANAADVSVISSEKNVKLDSGTLLLLRVS